MVAAAAAAAETWSMGLRTPRQRRDWLHVELELSDYPWLQSDVEAGRTVGPRGA